MLLFAVAADRTLERLPALALLPALVHQIVQFGAGVGGQRPYVVVRASLPLADTCPRRRRETALLEPDGARVPIRSADREGQTGADGREPDGARHLPRCRGRRPASPAPALAVNIDRERVRPRRRSTPEELPTGSGLKHVASPATARNCCARSHEHRVGRHARRAAALWLALLLAARSSSCYANRRRSRRRRRCPSR